MITTGDIKVLVVDDDDANRYFKTHVLSRNGYHVLEAARGEEAIRMAEAERPGLVLLDIKLPDMSGIDVCRHIKAGQPNVTVLQTSAAFTGARDRAAGLEGGADSYLVEPIEPGELIATVKALLRMRQAEQDLRSLNETLEERVAERTRDLAEANLRLAAEGEQRARAEEALRHAQKLDAIGQLTGGVAHDFNNLLTVILGNLDLISQGLGQSPQIPAEQIVRLVSGARRAAEDCERFTRQLLAFARRDVLRAEVVDLNQVLAGFENLLRRAVGERVTVELSLAPGLWACRVDPRQFEAAVLNLAVNARDAMPLGGQVRIDTRNIEVEAAIKSHATGASFTTAVPSGFYVSMCISDNGIGMTGEVLSRAFEPFFTTKDIGQGSGLGLSQVYGLVKQSGGHVSVDTRVGDGTKFTLYLPRSEAVPPQARERVVLSDDVPKGVGTVLVVEDNEVVREFAVAIMVDLGYRVLIATDGPSALHIIDGDEPIDLLFTDIVMPNRMSGAELAREARRLRPDLKVLMTSGYAARGKREEPATGEFPLISKPYRRAELAKWISEILMQQ